MQVTAPIEVIEADITTLAVDAIVNAANERMLGGGGVDGAIHRAAGRDLYEECRSVREVRPGVRCPTGEARITGGYNLAAKHVIHTVGPVWSGGHSGEDELLASCYRSCFALADEHEITSIAFPAISTGVYRFPLARATKIAVRETNAALKRFPKLAKVVFACFSREACDAYHREIAASER